MYGLAKRSDRKLSDKTEKPVSEDADDEVEIIFPESHDITE
jgi:hypothetical protein